MPNEKGRRIRAHFNHGWDKRYLVKWTTHCKRAYRRYLRSVKQDPNRVDVSKERRLLENGEFGGRNKKNVGGPLRTLQGREVPRQQIRTLKSYDDGTNRDGRWVFCIGKGTEFDPNADIGEPENLILLDFVCPKTEAFDPTRATLNGVPESLLTENEREESIVEDQSPADENHWVPPTVVIGEDVEAVLDWMKSDMDIQPTMEQIEAITQPAPLFINGQAGSGKTVMLAFRAGVEFADPQNKGNMLISAMSPHVTEILENAILDYTKEFQHHVYTELEAELENGEAGLAKRIRIVDVQRLFLAAMESNERRKFMAPGSDGLDTANLIGFGKFRNWFKSAFSKNELGAELAWFGIRSILLGNSHNFPTRYVPQQEFDQQLGHELFSDSAKDRLYAIFQKYRAWKEEQGKFDDLDIALAAFDNIDAIEPKYTRLMLDEAQDLTLLELHLLMAHLRKDARSEIILAGDPLQTINPTGFDWNSLKALMYREFSGLRMGDPYNLRTNFRSAKEIVTLGNVILDRQTFYAKRVKVEQGYVRSGRDVCLIDADAIPNDVFDDLVFNTRPATERMQLALVPDEHSLDDILSRLREQLGQGSTEHRFETVVQAKGRQASSVMLLYPGGQIGAANAPLLEANNDELARGFDDNQMLSLKFLLNQLYVAITRARSHLLIVDTAQNIEKIHQPAFGAAVKVLRSEKEIKKELSYFLNAASDEPPLQVATKYWNQYIASGRDEMYLQWIIAELESEPGEDEKKLFWKVHAERETVRAALATDEAAKSAHLRAAAGFHKLRGNIAQAYELYKDISAWNEAWTLLQDNPQLQRDNETETRLIGFLIGDAPTLEGFWDDVLTTKDHESVLEEFKDHDLVKRDGLWLDKAMQVLIGAMSSEEHVQFAILHMVDEFTEQSAQQSFLRQIIRQIEKYNVHLSHKVAEECWSGKQDFSKQLPPLVEVLLDADRSVLDSHDATESKIEASLDRLIALHPNRESAEVKTYETRLLNLKLKRFFAPNNTFDASIISFQASKEIPTPPLHHTRWKSLVEAYEEEEDIWNRLGLKPLYTLFLKNIRGTSFDKFSSESSSIQRALEIRTALEGLDGEQIASKISWWDHDDLVTSLERRTRLEAEHCSDGLSDPEHLDFMLSVLGEESTVSWINKNSGRVDEFIEMFQGGNETATRLRDDVARGWFSFDHRNTLRIDYRSSTTIDCLIEDLIGVEATHLYRDVQLVEIDEWPNILRLYRRNSPPTEDHKEDLERAIAALSRTRNTSISPFIQKIEADYANLPRKSAEILVNPGQNYSGDLARILDDLCSAVDVDALSWGAIWDSFRAWSANATERWEESFLCEGLNQAMKPVDFDIEYRGKQQRILRWAECFGDIPRDQSAFFAVLSALATHQPASVPFWLAILPFESNGFETASDAVRILQKNANERSYDTIGGWNFGTDLERTLAAVG